MLYLLPDLPLSLSKTKAEIYSLIILSRINEDNSQAIIQKGKIFLNKQSHPYYWLKYQDRIVDYALGQFFESPEHRYFNLKKSTFYQELPYKFNSNYQVEENIPLMQFLVSDFYHSNCCHWLRLKSYLNIDTLAPKALTKKEQIAFDDKINLLSLFDIAFPPIETKYLLSFDEWFEIFYPTFSPAFIQSDVHEQKIVFEHYHKQNDNLLYDLENLQKIGFIKMESKLVHHERRQKMISRLKKLAIINFQIIK